ncbi:MAG TPA: hypothetical protein PKZ75_02890 [Bacteroidia bacterium]|nr:hypothetical protein [Bacteroidia bacterium]
MIQILVVLDIAVFSLRCFVSRDATKDYINIGKLVIVVLFIILGIYNYKKYYGRYNKLKAHWKDESKSIRTLKGFLVIMVLLIPWIPIILMGVFWK